MITTTIEIEGRIDWRLLAGQRERLAYIVGATVGEMDREILTGIQHLLDKVSDAEGSEAGVEAGTRVVRGGKTMIYARVETEDHTFELIRYWGAAPLHCGVVTSTSMHGGRAMHWAMYVGSAPDTATTYEQAMLHIAEHGFHMPFADAALLAGKDAPVTERGYRD